MEIISTQMSAGTTLHALTDCGRDLSPRGGVALTYLLLSLSVLLLFAFCARRTPPLYLASSAN